MGSGGQIKTGAWDPEEDDLLYYWQSKVGNKWSEVAKHIPGRTGQQCAQRWRHKVNPNIRRDKWTADEDAKLIELVKTFGVGRWAEIARNCDGRTDQQCMGRWRRHLDPSIKRDCWTAEEDAKLRQLHAQYGTSWSRISKNLRGRTSQQCRARWHQINNTRSKSCGSGAGAAPAAAAAAAAASSGGRQASARKPASAKRRPSRRRHDSSCSEDDDDDDEDFYADDDDEEQEEAQDKQGGSSGGQSGTQPYEHDQQQQQEYAAAVAAAAAAAGYGYGAAELQQPWVASLAAGMIHGALSSASDPALQAALQQDRQQQPSGEGEEHTASEADEDEDAADYEGQGTQSPDHAPPLGRFKSLPSKLGGAAGAAAAAAGGGRGLKHTGSLPHGSSRGVPSSSGMSPGALWPAAAQAQHHQQFAGALTWSPSRMLLSPQRPEHLLRNGRGAAAAAAAAAADASKDMNEEEAAGAETLLEMASLLQQESCEMQPPLPQRSGDALPLPAYTPPKRPAGDRLEQQLPEGLSPSPYKRARGSRGALFHAEPEEDEEDDSEECDASEQQHNRRGRQGARRAAGGQYDEDLLEDDEPGPQQSPAAAGAGRRRRAASVRHYRVPHSKAADLEGAADEGRGLDTAAAAAAAGGASSAFLGDLGFRSSAGGGFQLEQAEQGEQAGRPSNASSLTGFKGQQDTVAAAAAAVAAAVFMSPPPAVRGSRLGAPPGSATTTPNRPAAQSSVMGLLGSPMFERMVGCATPPSAGRTQPSAATLAALQSPQPSRVPEPFWTPFTGLFQDALFSRGTSATPDLPSAGKPRLPRGLFSPAAQRSGSASAGKVVPRRGLIHQADMTSPLGAFVPGADDDKLGSQPSGGSAERPLVAAAADADVGPSPAAACGLQPPVGQVHHRVVRRLDQHEAWGTGRASPGKQARTGEGSTKRESLVGSGTGFSLFSPVKKQRVPLFNETSTIKVGATPSKSEAPDGDQLLPIAPLKHNLPDPGSSLDASSNLLQQPHSSPNRLAAVAASNLLHGRSPLGAKTRDRASTQLLQAAASAAEAPRHHHQQQQQQQQQQSVDVQQQVAQEQRPARGALRRASVQPDLEDEQQQQEETADDAEYEQEQPHAAGAEAYEAQQFVVGSPALERAGSINHRPMAYDEPDTPVNVGTADNTSCSGTPNTPAGMRGGDADASGRQQPSPNEYVTPPQHRLRASRPLAPLHKDCLIAAATRSLADGLAQQQRQHKQQAAAATAAAAATSAATAAAGSSAAAAVAAAAQDSPGQCSGDSSKIVSCERAMDSPLEAGVLTHSPSQWHQGMVAMLRSLQQTPLQLDGSATARGPAAAAAANAACADSRPAAAAGAMGGEVVNIKVCSRALRRLQDELERGTAATAAATAAIMARQQQLQSGQRSAKQEQQQQMDEVKDSDAQVPFSAGMSLGHAAAGAAGATCSTPLMLPLFTSPVSARGGSCSMPAKGSAAGAARTTVTPLALAPQASNGVASVSLTPAVVTLHHTPAASAAASAMTPRMPAMAWPVQQRSDGGLVVSAPMMTGGGPAAAAAAAGTLVQLTPGARSSTKAGTGARASPLLPPASSSAGGAAGAAVAGAMPAASAPAGMAGAAAAQQWPQVSPLSVVSIQPLLATACNAAVAAGQAAALQSVLALQPAAACGSTAAAAPASTGVTVSAGLPAAGTTGSTVRDSSHTVRSRLHALIDSV